MAKDKKEGQGKKDAGIPNETVFPKERKDVVEYRPGPPGEDCVSCAHFKEPESCEKVAGMIYRSGLCNLWEGEGAAKDAELEGLDQEGIEDMLFGGPDE